jgi:hypothetical protein
MVVDLAHDSLLNSTCSSLTLVILNNRVTSLLSRTNDLESGEALNTHATAELLVGLLITVNGSDLSETIEVLGGLFVGGLEVLTVAAPWGVELDNL